MYNCAAKAHSGDLDVTREKGVIEGTLVSVSGFAMTMKLNSFERMDLPIKRFNVV